MIKKLLILFLCLIAFIGVFGYFQLNDHGIPKYDSLESRDTERSVFETVVSSGGDSSLLQSILKLLLGLSLATGFYYYLSKKTDLLNKRSDNDE